MVTELSTVCIPASGTIHDSQVGFHSDIMFPFDKIMERSQKQLHGMTEEVQDKQYDKDMSRRKWWSERYSCDMDLQTILQYAERK